MRPRIIARPESGGNRIGETFGGRDRQSVWLVRPDPTHSARRVNRGPGRAGGNRRPGPLLFLVAGSSAGFVRATRADYSPSFPNFLCPAFPGLSLGLPSVPSPRLD